jgi:hypothetical protein
MGAEADIIAYLISRYFSLRESGDGDKRSHSQLGDYPMV